MRVYNSILQKYEVAIVTQVRHASVLFFFFTSHILRITCIKASV